MFHLPMVPLYQQTHSVPAGLSQNKDDTNLALGINGFFLSLFLVMVAKYDK